MTREELMNLMNEYYREHGASKGMDYAFGFFDAVGVLRDLTINGVDIKPTAKP